VEETVEFVAEVLVAGAPACAGRVLSFDAGGALIEFRRAESPLLAVADEVDVRFRGDPLGDALTVSTRVVLRMEAPPHRSYKVQPTGAGASDLRALLRRRGSGRARPEPGEVVSVSLASAEHPHAIGGRLFDLSISGHSVLVSREDEAAFAGAERVVSCLELPGDEERPLRVAGRILHRRLSGDALRYGITHDAQRTADHAAVEDRIHRWVAERQD